MGTSGSASDVTPGDIRSVFSRLDEPYVPLTTAEVAEKLDCNDRTARSNLEALAERGELRAKRIDDRSEVWWPSGSETGPIQRRSQLREFGAFVSAVEDYAIFMLDPDGRVASWNEGAQRIKNYTEDEIVGEHFSTFYTDEDVGEGLPETNLEVAKAEGRVEDEGWRVREDGSRFWANVVITAIRDESGTLQGFTKVTRDMTERRERQQELRRERNFTEQVLETVPVSICVISSDGEFVRANRQMLDRFGIEESALGEYSFESWEIYDAEGESIPRERWPLTRVLETGEPVYGYECQVDLPDVGRRWLSINVALLEEGQSGDGTVVLSVDDITGRKERERHLRRERDQTEQLLRTAPIAIEVSDAEGNTVMANRRAQEALGLSEQEFIDEPEDADEREVYDADGKPLEPSETPAARVLATGEPLFDEELVFDLPRRERMQFRVNAAPLFGPDGEIERVVTAGEDITELKTRERQLERRKTELETELGEILDRISDAFYALDREWRFTHLNERAAEIMQRSPDELLDRALWEAFPDATNGVYREKFRAAMETQTPVSFEVHGGALDAWLEFNVYPSETGLSIYFRDITDRKERERELAKYETIVETIHDGIYVKDEDGYFTMVNDAYAELTGYSREKLVGAHASLVVDEATIERAKETKAAMSDDGAANPTMEATIRAANGDRIPAEGTFAVIETDDGESEQVGVVRDISDRKKYQRQLEESNERLEQFAYAASHDLQEPLRMVTSYLRLLERRYDDELDDDGREFLDFAVDGAERMREMIDGLLDYSRVETQGDPFEPIDLNAVLSDVRDDLQIQIAESDAEITVETLPTVEGDAGQLRQVFQNLLDNAIKYSDDEPPRVHVAAEPSGREWTISVSDEGIGIDPDDAGRIFEVFQRLHSREEHAGTGIGLALCRRIIERHGGEIWVESEPGEGASFSFTLPVEEEYGE